MDLHFYFIILLLFLVFMIVGLMGEAVVMAKLFLLLAARLILSRDNRRQFVGKRALTTIIPSLLLLAL